MQVKQQLPQALGAQVPSSLEEKESPHGLVHQEISGGGKIMKKRALPAIVLMSLVMMLITTLMTSGQTASGGSNKEPHKDRFGQMDANNDGFITLEEFLSHETKKFQSIDTNGDGKISQAEMEAHESKRQSQGRGGNRFASLDSNKDGFITLAEYLAGEKRKFQSMDTNGDGKISKDEMGQERASGGSKNSRTSGEGTKSGPPADGEAPGNERNSPGPSKNE
jgi:Ca2+-binding EF-hand superfamily protein